MLVANHCSTLSHRQGVTAYGDVGESSSRAFMNGLVGSTPLVTAAGCCLRTVLRIPCPSSITSMLPITKSYPPSILLAIKQADLTPILLSGLFDGMRLEIIIFPPLQ